MLYFNAYYIQPITVVLEISLRSMCIIIIQPIMIVLEISLRSMCNIYNLLRQSWKFLSGPCVLYTTYYGSFGNFSQVNVYYIQPTMVILKFLSGQCVLYTTYYGSFGNLSQVNVYYLQPIMVVVEISLGSNFLIFHYRLEVKLSQCVLIVLQIHIICIKQ